MDNWYVAHSEILEYDPDEDLLLKRLGRLIRPRYEAAISVVKVKDYAKWCDFGLQ